MAHWKTHPLRTILLLGLIACSHAPAQTRIARLHIGLSDTLIVQQYVLGCRGDGQNWARITREGDSLKVRYWSLDTTWVLYTADGYPIDAVSNFCMRIGTNHPGCMSTTTDFYLASFNFRRLNFTRGNWYVGESVNIDDVKNHATFIRESCGENDYPWHQFIEELSSKPLVIGGKEDRRQRRHFRRR
ncbi:MAG: hypothetical protein JNM91_13260 [Flavobacteriales bacterium]|nr:hypothetical protein [Flavobacteriales bacterium]